MVRVAVIDVGTVTARLAIADCEGDRVVSLRRTSEIVNLGQGVDETGYLREDAQERLLRVIDGYLKEISASRVDAVCSTMTSAARDARNAQDLVDAFSARGLASQVIPSTVEGSLTFLGVAQDFASTPLIVADNGGGSTEFALGELTDARELDLSFVRSIDVGCRRLTEKFLAHADPPEDEDVELAHEFCHDAFQEIVGRVADAGLVPGRLVVTGGTVTTLVALKKRLVPYDSTQVHLATLTREDVLEQERHLASVPLKIRAQLKGIQVKRAPVILGGAIAVGEIMDTLGFSELTVSESDLLVGLSLTVAACVQGNKTPLDWTPLLS